MTVLEAVAGCFKPGAVRCSEIKLPLQSQRIGGRERVHWALSMVRVVLVCLFVVVLWCPGHDDCAQVFIR